MISEKNIIIGILIVIILSLIVLASIFYMNYKNKACVIKQYIKRDCNPLTEVYDCSSDKKCVNFQCIPK
jgi:hypothetical protein